MESKGLGLMVTLQLYKQNLDSFLDRIVVNSQILNRSGNGEVSH